MLSRMIRALGFVVVIACSAPPKTTTVTFDDAPHRFDDLAAIASNHLHRYFPANAVALGLHEFDGKLPDRSPDALDQMAAQLEKDRAALAAVEVTTELQKLERDVLLYEIRK